MKPSQITEEMYARIPTLLEQGMTKAAIAAMWGVKLSTLKVFCSRRGISLRKGGPPKLVPRKLVLPLSNHVLKSLREAARSLGKDSTERLVSDLLEKIVSDDLYKAVLDEEATPDRPVMPEPQSDPTFPPPSEQADPTGLVHSPPLVNDQDSSITAGATTAAATNVPQTS